MISHFSVVMPHILVVAVGLYPVLVYLLLTLMGFWGRLISGLSVIAAILYGFAWLHAHRVPDGAKVVPRFVSDEVDAELRTDLDDIEFEPGTKRILSRVGVAMRLAREVKMRFGGTPAYTAANKLVAARHIEAVFEDNCLRKVDRLRLFHRVRALVFIRSPEEMEEEQWINSTAGLDQHERAVGWHSVEVSQTFGCLRTEKVRQRRPDTGS